MWKKVASGIFSPPQLWMLTYGLSHYYTYFAACNGIKSENIYLQMSLPREKAKESEQYSFIFDLTFLFPHFPGDVHYEMAQLLSCINNAEFSLLC